MKTRSVALLCCLALAAALGYAQSMDPGYQMAKVVTFERAAADAQHMEKSDNYKMAMRVGDILYKCRASGSASSFIDWSEGKEFPAQVNEKEKTMMVKGPNGTVQLTITGKKMMH
jgi:hypothetical protein